MRNRNPQGKAGDPPRRLRCAIYTRKSTEEGLDQEFNSLDAQREAAEAFILSQRREGWIALPARYDDGGFTGANMERPALQRLLKAVETGEVDCVVVYKVDRLSRSLLDFTRILSLFEKSNVSFVAVTRRAVRFWLTAAPARVGNQPTRQRSRSLGGQSAAIATSTPERGTAPPLHHSFASFGWA